MVLTSKQIQERTDLVYKRFRAKHTFDEAMLIREFCDQLIDELIWLEKREGKELSKEDQNIKEQERINTALKMNNPLHDI